ncbi:MAG TPA: ferritin family protein [Desulfuromonadales bacterium]|nr:ferritin family protein [Desulfuromonadales bacterium]
MTGIEDFSGFEVIRAAMEVEKKGHRFYTTMAERADNQITKEVFSWLAQDEVQHLKTLEDLVPQYQEGAFWDAEEEFLPYLRRFSEQEIFPSPERLESVLKEKDSDLKALELAIHAEEKFAEYFHRAEDKARTEEGKEAFAWLAAEEDRHAAVLIERRDKIKKALHND